MSAPEPVCEYVEDVADGSMCMCGIPALTHDAVMAAREQAAMTVPEPTPTAEHIDNGDLQRANIDTITAVIARRGFVRQSFAPRDSALDLLTSTDPAAHLAMLDALVRAGVLTEERAPISRGMEHHHWQQRWDGQHTHEGRRYVTRWDVAP